MTPQELKALLEKSLPWELEEKEDLLVLKSIDGVIFAWRILGEFITFQSGSEILVKIECKLDPASSRSKSFNPQSQTLVKEIEAFVGIGGVSGALGALYPR